MGNSGTVLAALFAPGLAMMFGWNAVFGLAVIPLAITFLIYMALAKDAPDAPAPRPLAAYLEPLQAGRCLVVHVLLQRHLRRLRRPCGELSASTSPTSSA